MYRDKNLNIATLFPGITLSNLHEVISFTAFLWLVEEVLYMYNNPFNNCQKV